MDQNNFLDLDEFSLYIGSRHSKAIEEYLPQLDQDALDLIASINDYLLLIGASSAE